MRGISFVMIRKLKSGEFRLYSRKKNAKTGKRKNLGTFSSLAAAKKHERQVVFSATIFTRYNCRSGSLGAFTHRCCADWAFQYARS